MGVMPLLTPDDIRRAEFRSWRGFLWWPDRYDADEVDDLLDDAAESLRRVNLWVLIVNSRVNAYQACHRHRRALKRNRKQSIKQRKGVRK